MDLSTEIARLKKRSEETMAQLYKADALAKSASCAMRTAPIAKDYIEAMITGFEPLTGDRKFSEDNAIIAGFGRFHGRVAILGQKKEHDTETRLKHNFGMARQKATWKPFVLWNLLTALTCPLSL